MSGKAVEYSYKIVKRNEFLFYKKMLKDKYFYFDLNNLSIKYFGQELELDKMSIEPIEVFLQREKINKFWVKNIITNSEFTEALIPDVVGFLNNNNLGNEWIQTIVIFLISGTLYFPAHNLNISNLGTKKDELRVVLELNPDSTIDDIKSIWAKVKKLQKELNPAFRTVKLTKKSFKNLELYIKDFNSKRTSNEYKKSRDIGKVSDLFPDFSPKKIDIKRAQNLRQIRHRFKRDKT